MTKTLDAYLTAEAKSIAEACITCGDCVRVCPVVPYGRAADADPDDVVDGILGLLRDSNELPYASRDWLNMCNGCTACIPACPEDVNPRHMLMIASHLASEKHSETPELFKRMARAIKLLIAMQVIPDEFKHLFVPGRGRMPEVVFYTGCNALRTPHLLFNTMYILDALGIDYDVAGGPSVCCGVIASKWEGRIAGGGRQTKSTLKRLSEFGSERVLNWCPTCELHLADTLKDFTNLEFQFEHVTNFIVEEMARRDLSFSVQIQRRVVLHGHQGSPKVTEAVAALLKAIPGLELIETVMESGYTCGGSGCGKAPDLAAKEHAEVLDRAEELGADILVTLFHGCHAIFVAGGVGRSFDVVNFTDLIATALDKAPHPDTIKAFHRLSDLELILDEALPMLHANGLEIDREWLRRYLPNLFSSEEFRGGLQVLSAGPPRGNTGKC